MATLKLEVLESVVVTPALNQTTSMKEIRSPQTLSIGPYIADRAFHSSDS